MDERVLADRLLRLKEIIGDPKADPPIRPIIPVSKSTWWSGVRSGRFPQPVRLPPRVTCWTARSIQKLVASVATECA